MNNNSYSPKPIKLKSYIFKFKKEFLLQAIGGIIYNTVIVFGSIFLGATIDAASLIGQSEMGLWNFYASLFMFLGVTLTFQIARYFKRFYMRILVNKMSCDIRTNLLDSIFSTPLSAMGGEKTGDIMSRIVGDVDSVCASVQTSITELWDTVLLILSYFVACMFFSPSLTLMASLPIPLVLLLTQVIRRTNYNLSQKSRKSASKINVHLQHKITGTTLLRLFGLEQNDNERLEVLLRDNYKWQVYSNILQGGITPINILIANLGVVLVLGIGGRYVVSNTWTIGSFTAYLTMFIAMSTRVTVGARVINTWYSAKASWDRICEKIASDVHNIEKAENPTVTISKDGLSIKNLSFKYSHSSESIIDDFSLNVKNGQIVGITGPVGSGKSALAAAISGLYSAGRDPQIAYMDSNHFIFSDDVIFNVTLGDNLESIQDALSIAELDEDISTFQSGLNTRLMEQGLRISGGQRQRMALARAWASSSRILILDDPFSAIDISMENKIMSNLRNNIKDRIILLFSHRISTFDKTDIILVLSNGKIVEHGSHYELCAKKGLYSSIYKAQTFVGGSI